MSNVSTPKDDIFLAEFLAFILFHLFGGSFRDYVR